MRVLVTGCSGFIGSRLAQALRAAGHEVVCAARAGARGTGLPAVPVDFSRDFDPQVWVPRLAGIDAVVNAVGILRESREQRFEAIHVRAPAALFSACVSADVRRVIQISALGADAQARSGYHLSKRRADDSLSKLPLDWTIVQPSLVFGLEGTSARLFTGLASLPVIPVPGRGEQPVQPVHIEDLVSGILALLNDRAAIHERVPFVGPEPMSLREMLQRLRGAMGLGPTRILHMPLAGVKIGARWGDLTGHGLLDSETLGMLTRGNTGDPQALQRLLRRRPLEVAEFIPASQASLVRNNALLQWLLPMLRWSIAAVWIVTGIVSLGVYPIESSLQLLQRVGITATVAPVLLYGAAAMDFAFGIATLLLRRRRLLWIAQIAAIVLYTAIISWKLPEFWIHPFGPLLKNLPMLAAIVLLYRLERR